MGTPFHVPLTLVMSNAVVPSGDTCGVERSIVSVPLALSGAPDKVAVYDQLNVSNISACAGAIVPKLKDAPKSAITPATRGPASFLYMGNPPPVMLLITVR